MKDAWFWGAPWLTFNLFPILVALSSSRGDADRSLKLASPGGCTVSTMDLSEAPGLVLFRVVREGIGISQRLSASGTLGLQAIGMLTLEPERLKNQRTTTRRRSPEMEGDLHRRSSSGLRLQIRNVEC